MQEGPSASMEDYLEMIYRISREEPAVRIHRLAAALHIKDSSATRMARQLAGQGYIHYRPYDCIRLTPEGEKRGQYLLYRHRVVEEFLTVLNGRCDLMEAELLEHHMSETTVENLRRLTLRLQTSVAADGEREYNQKKKQEKAP